MWGGRWWRRGGVKVGVGVRVGFAGRAGGVEKWRGGEVEGVEKWRGG